MTSTTLAGAVTVERFAECIAARDLPGIASCLAPGVRFRALTPNHTWAHFGVASAINTIQNWFEDVDAGELVDVDAQQVGDKIRVGYRLRLHDHEGWHQMEQQAFCVVTDDRISDISIICSGNQPESAEITA